MRPKYLMNLKNNNNMITKGTVSGVIANMVTLTVDGPVAQGEICYIETGGDRLMAEVIKVANLATRCSQRWFVM